ncbi:MAG: hypothetical protein EA353_11070 [Puniceicoccaceae bacterium]|nr:MAG: hypothetical protein EA353_11070 [Puniceicoccaceae bacterium]
MDQNQAQQTVKTRQVGVELEFGGLTLERICQLVQQSVGGELELKSRYTASLHHTQVGQIKVELDAVLFSEFKLRGLLRGLPVAKDQRKLTDLVEEALASEARRWVPFELVFSPLPFDRISEIDVICQALSAEAEGTGASIYNAFGLHFNPELPQVDAATILRYLRAFIILYDSLKKAHNIDMTRQISPFITPFPLKYKKRVLDPNYQPKAEQLITDYLTHNATRNRALDLLPLFAHMNAALVRQHLPKEKINARPTLHYRLPDCRIDDPEWSVSQEWAVYQQIEDLANDPAVLAREVRLAHESIQHPIRSRLKQWARAIWKCFYGR